MTLKSYYDFLGVIRMLTEVKCKRRVKTLSLTHTYSSIYEWNNWKSYVCVGRGIDEQACPYVDNFWSWVRGV